MKLCALSPFHTASAAEILDFLQAASFTLVALPGAAPNTPAPEAVQRILRPGVRVLLEARAGRKRATPYLVSRTRVVAMPRQVFSVDPTAAEMDTLAAAWPQRTFVLGAHRVTFVLCGEINGFNPDGTVKYGRALPHDILVNAAHTVMGRWNHLGRKLARLSRHTAVLHTANNDRNHHELTTNVRVYHNGRLMPARHHTEMLTWCVLEI